MTVELEQTHVGQGSRQPRKLSLADDYNRARLRAVQAPHASDWLFALPIAACGLRLDDEAVRVAVGLRLGVNICEPHECQCGTLVKTNGAHELCGCRKLSDY